MGDRKLSVTEKKTQEEDEIAMNIPMSHRFSVLHLPSLVRRGVKMVKARIVAVGKRTLRRAVPLKTVLSTYTKWDSSTSSSDKLLALLLSPFSIRS